jgi:hypothetical protein
MRIGGNDYNVRELAGAFGDLGTLIPLVVGYITVAKMDPAGVLIAFGLFKVIAGLTFRTPIPIQPMKAIGIAAISHAGMITPSAISASGLFTGVLWLLMGLTGAVTWIATMTSRPVIHGLVLGLGLGFFLEGVNLMQGDLVLAAAAIVLTFVLLSYERVPAMLLLLAFGVGVAALRDPALVTELSGISPRLRLPDFAPTRIGWPSIVTGVLFLGLPQTALTLGNVIVATVEENQSSVPGPPGDGPHDRDRPRDHEPGRDVDRRELAAGVRTDGAERADHYVTLFTAGAAMWNVGAGCLLDWRCGAPFSTSD